MQGTLGAGNLSGAACQETPSSAWHMGEEKSQIFCAMLTLAKRRPGMFASVVMGQYCRVHQLLFISSLQEWLSYSPAPIAHAFGDAIQVREATCPQCLAMTQTALHRQFPALYGPSAEPVTTRV